MVKKKKRKKDFSFFNCQMIVKYFNTNFKNINNNQNIDQNISNIIKKIPSLNILSDENLLEETKKISHQFREKKKK